MSQQVLEKVLLVGGPQDGRRFDVVGLPPQILLPVGKDGVGVYRPDLFRYEGMTEIPLLDEQFGPHYSRDDAGEIQYAWRGWVK